LEFNIFLPLWKNHSGKKIPKPLFFKTLSEKKKRAVTEDYIKTATAQRLVKNLTSQGWRLSGERPATKRETLKNSPLNPFILFPLAYPTAN